MNWYLQLCRLVLQYFSELCAKRVELQDRQCLLSERTMLILHIAHQLINSINLPRAHEVEYMLNLRRAQSQDGQRRRSALVTGRHSLVPTVPFNQVRVTRF